jgi:HAD superfamily hydrolase (TIGR01490 family)
MNGECDMSSDTAKPFAFFDVDDTIVSLKSILSFQDFWFDAKGDEDGRSRFAQLISALTEADASWEVIHRQLAQSFALRHVAEVALQAGHWFSHVEATHPALFHAPVIARLHDHQKNGIEPVFVSGSFPPLIAPIATRLGVTHCLATILEIADGRYTGRGLPPQTIGQGKAEAMRRFLTDHGGDAGKCFAYADDISDVPMLEMVGHPVAVLGGRGLETHARTLGWECIAPK